MRRSKPVAIAVAVVRHDGHVLIGQRPSGTQLAGFWEFPGGKVRPGESGEEAAVRECLEEAGLRIRVSRMETEVSHRYDFGAVAIRFFAAEPAEPSPTAMGPFRWVRIADLPQYRFPPANEVILDYLRGEC